jgi:hypothetical protein
MRNTVRLDPHLLADAERVAAATGKTLTMVVEDALRESLVRREISDGKLPTFGGNGLRPGLDLDHSAQLLDLMEDRVDTPGCQRPDLRPSRRRR